MADEKLKKAMEEIKFVLQKYDIAATISLSTESDLEFLYRLDTSWSIVSSNNDEVRITALAEDYPSKEQQKKAVEDSANMLLGLRESNRFLHAGLSSVTGMLEDRFDLDFKLGEMTPHISTAAPKTKQ